MLIEPPHLTKPDRPSYIELIEAAWPDFAAIKAFEIDVAAAIIRYVLKQDSQSLYVIMRWLHLKHQASEVRRVVWNRIAPSWINVYDCSGPEDDLWVAAMDRAYYKVFEDTFDYPSERNEVI